MADQTEASNAPRSRGPGYPVLDLETAIERARELSEVSQRHGVPLAHAAEVWGYSPRSSNTLKTAAALKRFGFVEDVGDGASRQLRLTQFARELLFHAEDRDSPDWPRMLREAALKPKIHREVLARFDGSLPDDRIAEHYLIFELHFNDEAARDFLKKLRSTLSFARVDMVIPDSAQVEVSTVAMPDQIEVQSVEDSSAQKARFVAARTQLLKTTPRPYGGSPGYWVQSGEAIESEPAAPAAGRVVNIPYSPGKWATLDADFPLTGAEWRRMMEMLAAMQPGLVADPLDDDAGD